MKFANIIYSKRNDRLTIGDDMQLLAIENLYNYMNIDYENVIRIPFHELTTYDGEYVILPISFPLTAYSHEDIITCFSDKIIPVFLGLCVLQDNYSEQDVQYFKRYEPIGCRDKHTLTVMRHHGILAYLNTCMSVGFPKRVFEENLNKRNKIICIDVNETLKSKIPQELLKNCEFLSHTFYQNEFEGTAEELCKKMYNKYINEARLIVTTRIHAALPCAAAGLPVIFAKDKFSYRFSGIDRLLKIYTLDEYDNINWNPDPYDFEDVKQIMLDLAKERLIETYKKYSKIFDLSFFFETHNRKQEYIEFLTDTYDYIDNKCQKEDIEYILWGVTQTSSMIKSYFDKNYPSAKLVAIVDKVKRIKFCGIDTGPKENILTNRNAIVFVTSGAAIQEANIFFKENQIKNYYHCCIDSIDNKNDKL